jgi:methylthioribose-1-phosphate isomerase
MDLTQLGPLFWPVRESEDGFSVLDETKLPAEIQYIPIREIDKAVEVVREMKTRAFGQVLTFFHSVLLSLKSSSETDKQGLEAKVGELGRLFSEARPTFAFLGLAEQILGWLAGSKAEDLKSFLVSEIQRYFRILMKMREKRGQLAASLLPQSCSILTHCNCSGDLVLIGSFLRERGARVRFFATETRPYLQGTRLTAWELARAGFDVHLLPDRGAGQVIERGLVDTVIVGSDRSTRRGDVINKVGTYPLALAAKVKGIPFYALVQDFDETLDDEVTIEERPHEELLSFNGRRLAPDGVKCRYPAFDITPANLVTRLIGFASTYSACDFKEKFGRGGKKSTDCEMEEETYLLIFGVPRREFYCHLLEGSRIEGKGEILIPEMRPGLFGARELTPSLLHAGLKPTLVSDNMLGFFFQRQAIRRAYLAYEEFTPLGPRVPGGGRMVVELARAHEVPIELIPAGEEKSAPLDLDVTTLLRENVSGPGVSPYLLQDEVIPWSVF